MGHHRREVMTKNHETHNTNDHLKLDFKYLHLIFSGILCVCACVRHFLMNSKQHLLQSIFHQYNHRNVGMNLQIINIIVYTVRQKRSKPYLNLICTSTFKSSFCFTSFANSPDSSLFLLIIFSKWILFAYRYK